MHGGFNLITHTHQGEVGFGCSFTPPTAAGIRERQTAPERQTAVRVTLWSYSFCETPLDFIGLLLWLSEMLGVAAALTHSKSDFLST